MSYLKVTRTASGTTKTHRLGIRTYFDNVWRTIGGGDLYYEAGVDTNLRAVMGFGNNRELWFHPKADGIHNSTYHNQNDWAVLRYRLCPDLVNPGGTVNNAIRCAAVPSGISDAAP